jgi:REP element-mobilizing transposase RayT
MPSTKPAGHKLRIGRVSIKNQVYLVTFVTQGRQCLFTDFHCARLLIKSLNTCKHAKTLAFVVMPDHVHWLIQLRGSTSLSRVLQTVKSVSANHMNRYFQRRGQIWQSGFHDHALRNEESVIDAARYIIANPLRARLVANVREYPHWDAIWI